FDYLNWFGYDYFGYRVRNAAIRIRGMNSISVAYSTQMKEEMAETAPAVAAELEEKSAEYQDFDDLNPLRKNGNTAAPVGGVKQDFSEVKVRTNFNETAFFYPTLMTNEKGEIIVKFTVPEA